MLPSSCGTLVVQGPSWLLQSPAAALDLLRWQHAARAAIHSSSSGSAASPSSSGAAKRKPGLLLSLLGGSSSSPPPRCLHTGSSTAAWMHHSALLESDEDTNTTSSSRQQQQQQPAGRSSAAASAAAWPGLEAASQQQLQQRQQQAHQQQHVGQLHNLAGPLNANNNNGGGVGQQPATAPRYQGHVHAPHGRRHAATSRSQVDRFISEQLLLCKSLGMLRRIMIKHKATMEPEHVADTVLCLQHLVRLSRNNTRTRPAAGARAGLPFAAQQQQQPSQARSQPRVRAAGEFSRSRLRASESDGHMEQLVAQMLGELGSMIWFMMGDMTGPDLAKVLYAWSSLEWHPEPELLADVTASFMSAAAGGGLQRPEDDTASSSTSSSSGSTAGAAPMQPGWQQSAELEVWQGPWMAAGLWGLLKLGEPCEGNVLQLLRQHWQQMAGYWTPQQLADLAAALTATADEQVAQGQLQQQQQGGEEQHMVPIVLGLSQQLLAVLQQQQQDGSSDLLVPLPWPESMLVQVQQSLLNPAGVPAGAQRAAAAVSEIAAAASSSASSSSSSDAGVPMMAVHNVPQLAWRMLQALTAVGVNVSEPADPAVGALVAQLSAATKVVSMAERAL